MRIRSSRFDVLWIHLLLLYTFHLYNDTYVVYGFDIRQATSNDVNMARMILFKEAMNPLSLLQKNMLVAYKDDDEDNDGDSQTSPLSSKMIGFGQIRSIDEKYAELASLYVDPNFRHQGIGGKLVETLLERHNEECINDDNSTSKQKVCLLTLKPTIPFYERHGFRISTKTEREMMPNSLKMEYIAGSAISAVLGNDIVYMIEKD